MHHRIKGNWVGGLLLSARHSIGKAGKVDRRRRARKGIIHSHPSRRLSSADGSAITLRNCAGELARYSVTRRRCRPADAGIPGKNMERCREIARGGQGEHENQILLKRYRSARTRFLKWRMTRDSARPSCRREMGRIQEHE